MADPKRNIGGFTLHERVRVVKNAGEHDGRTGVVMTLDHDHGWRLWMIVTDHPETPLTDPNGVSLYVDPDDLEHLPELAVAPGTTGTATVRGVEDVRVMRVTPGPNGSHSWVSPNVPTPDGEHFNWLHGESNVTDFVPDEDAPSACADDGVSICPKMAYSNKQLQRDRAEARVEIERLTDSVHGVRVLTLGEAAGIILREVGQVFPFDQHKDVKEAVEYAAQVLAAEARKPLPADAGS